MRINSTRRSIPGVDLRVHHMLPRGTHTTFFIKLIKFSCAKNRQCGETRYACILIRQTSRHNFFHSRNLRCFKAFPTMSEFSTVTKMPTYQLQMEGTGEA